MTFIRVHMIRPFLSRPLSSGGVLQQLRIDIGCRQSSWLDMSHSSIWAIIFWIIEGMSPTILYGHAADVVLRVQFSQSQDESGTMQSFEQT